MEKKKSYSELLRSPMWQKKRLEIMERDGFTCQYCGRKDRELQVHHRVYHKGAKPWEYDDSELITLCNQCHEAETETKLSHYEIFQDICKLGREIGLSEQFIGYAFSYIVGLLESISLKKMDEKTAKLAFDLLLGTCNNKDATILFESGLSLDNNGLEFLKMYCPQIIDVYKRISHEE